MDTTYSELDKIKEHGRLIERKAKDYADLHASGFSSAAKSLVEATYFHAYTKGFNEQKANSLNEQ